MFQVFFDRILKTHSTLWYWLKNIIAIHLHTAITSCCQISPTTNIKHNNIAKVHTWLLPCCSSNVLQTYCQVYCVIWLVVIIHAAVWCWIHFSLIRSSCRVDIQDIDLIIYCTTCLEQSESVELMSEISKNVPWEL